MRKAKKASDVIVENIQSNDGKIHALKALFDGTNTPEITSIGYVNLPDTNKFVSYTIRSKGREIIHMEVGEPDSKAIAEDEAKLNFVTNFMAGVDG